VADHETFVRDAVRLMLENAVFHGTDRRRPVLNWKSPEELCAAFDFQLNRSATTHGHLLSLIEGTIEHSVKTGHPYFVNQLFSRCVEISRFTRLMVHALLFRYAELI
jgi:glutamate decarboxylase